MLGQVDEHMGAVRKALAPLIDGAVADLEAASHTGGGGATDPVRSLLFCFGK